MTPRAVVTIGLALLGALMVGVAQITGDSGPTGHPLGAEVVVGHVDAGMRTQIGLTVLRVRKGLPREEGVPYFVDARYANKGPNAATRNLSVGLEDAHGDLIRRPIFVGDDRFVPCREIREGRLEPGESYESCTFFLVPESVDVGLVYFLSDKGPDQPPELVYWATK